MRKYLPHIIVIIFIVIAGGLFAFKHTIESKITPSTMESQLSKSLNMTVKIKDVKVALSGRLFLYDITVLHNEKQVLSVQRVVTGIDIWHLLKGTITIKEIGLDSPTIVLTPNILKDLSSRIRPPEKPAAILRVIIEQGGIIYDNSPHTSITLKQINGSFKTNGQEYEGSLEGKGEKGEGDTYRISGHYTPNKNSITISANQIPIKTWKDIFNPGDITQIDGKGSFNITATGTLPDITLEGDIKINDGSIYGYPVKEFKSKIKTTSSLFTLSQLSWNIGDGVIEGEANGQWPTGKNRQYKISATGNIKNVSLSKLSLPNISIPADGIMEGTISFESNLGKSQLKGSINIPKGSFNNGPEFSALATRFVSGNREFTLNDGKMIVFGGELKFTGSIKRDSSLSLDFNANSLDLSEEKWLKQNNISMQKGGNLKGKLTGKLPNLSLSGYISLPQLQYKSKQINRLWNNVSLDINAGIKDKEIELKNILLSANNQTLPVSGNIRWSPNNYTQLIIDKLPLSRLITFFQLPPEVLPASGNLKAKVFLQKESKEISGNIDSFNGMLAGLQFDAIAVQFKGSTSSSIPFSGNISTNNKKIVLQGIIKKEDFNISLHGKDFPVSKLSILRAKLPGLHGNLSFDTTFTASRPDVLPIKFSLQNGVYKGRKIPEIKGDITWQNSITKIAEISFPKLTPPLTISGTITNTTNTVSLSSRLNGQSIKTLSSLIPFESKLISGIDGKLLGDFTISGKLQAPYLSFNGKAMGLIWNNINLGNGPLTLSGTAPNNIQASFSAKNLPIASIPGMSKFIPALEGTVDLDIEHTGAKTKLKVQSTHLKLQGKTFPSATSTIYLEPQLVKIEQLELPLTTPPLPISGTINRDTNNINFTSALNGQRLNQLLDIAKLFSNNNIASSIQDGTLHGKLKLSGKLPAPQITFSGRTEGLKVSGMSIDNGNLSLSLQPQAGIYVTHFSLSDLELQKIDVISKQLPQLKGNLTLEGVLSSKDISKMKLGFTLTKGMLDNRPLPSINGEFIWQEPVIILPVLHINTTPPIIATSEFNTSSKLFSLHSTLSGNSIKSLTPLSGFSSQLFDANLNGKLSVAGSADKTKIRFNGKGKNISFQDINFGNGELDFSLEGEPAKPNTTPKFNLDLIANQLQSQQISLLQTQYPGLSGEVRLQTIYNSNNPNMSRIFFNLSNASRKGTSFPSIDCSLIWQDPVLRFSPFRLPDANPPLDISGTLNNKNKQLEMNAQLSGQSMATLMKLAGATTIEMDGRLTGPLSIRGSSTEPHITFKGEISRLRYKNMELGAGDLTLFATPYLLDGKLTLHSISTPFIILAQLFGLSPGNIQPVIIIKGTPKDPKITISHETKTTTPKSEQHKPTEIEKLPKSEEIIEDILENIFKPKKKK